MDNHSCMQSAVIEIVKKRQLTVVDLQLASGSELAEVKRRVGVVKRVCRQRTLGAWKEWRTSMEQHRATWLATHLHLLQQDHAHLHSGLDRVHQVHSQLQQLQTGLRDGMAAQRIQQQASTCG